MRDPCQQVARLPSHLRIGARAGGRRRHEGLSRARGGAGPPPMPTVPRQLGARATWPGLCLELPGSVAGAQRWKTRWSIFREQSEKLVVLADDGPWRKALGGRSAEKELVFF